MAKLGRPKANPVNKLYNRLNSEIYEIYKDLRAYKHPRGQYFKVYYANSDLKKLQRICERISNLIYSIDVYRSPIPTKKKRLEYIKNWNKEKKSD